MNTQVIKIVTEEYPEEELKKIVSVLKKDGVIVYPTETFYGLGANCLSPRAVEKIFALKGRDRSKPLLVVVSDRDMLESLVTEVPPVAEALIVKYWPGPLTLIFRANRLLPREFTGAGKTVGVRLPAHEGLIDLVKEAGFPITATSANISGEDEISDPQKVMDIFTGKVNCIVDGGKTKGGHPSTVVDLTSPKPRILREGAIPSSKLKKWLEK
jgi:L-threonylcarbamoyladenylate synthase